MGDPIWFNWYCLHWSGRNSMNL